MTMTKPNPEANLGQIGWLLQEFLLWNMNRVRDAFGGDIDSALILGEIAHHNRQMQFVRSNAERGDAARPPMSPANIRGISRATSIPRETVRRKVQRLAQQGWLRVGPAWQLFATPPESPEHERETLVRFLELASTVCASLRRDACADTELQRLVAGVDARWKGDGAGRSTSE
ncbi:MAG: hypothetical protein IT532_01330 [Burkholderiales bacterium]|nr:hypothetical protein [Burkholderiales bacterium]